MYQALYRKYRPTNFDEVAGQNIIINTLKNAVGNNKISHAYLFTGPRGTGKTSIAKIFAKTVNCTNLKNMSPCNNCVNCTQINNKQSNDIIEIDAASNNGVDEIREIRNKVNLVPSTGKYKIYIIDEVHMLTQGAFNALLKTLEEPPAHIIFILATTEPHKIPATILSRCQRFDFKRIAEDQIVSYLQKIASEEKIDIELEALHTIAKISDGGMRDSISLLDQVNSYKNGNITVDDVHKVNGSLSSEVKYKFIDLLINKDLAEILQMIDEFNEEGKNLIKVLEEITNTLKDLLFYKISIHNENKYSNLSEEYLKLADIISTKKLVNLIDTVNNNLSEIKQANDSKLAVELLLIKECYQEVEATIEYQKVDVVETTRSIINKTQSIKEEDGHSETFESVIVEEKQQSEEKPIVSQPVEKEEIKIPIIENDFLEEVKTRRIENTLAHFNKNEFKIIKNKVKTLEDYITDKKYNKIASLIMDGELKAASDEYLLFVYETDGSSNHFNNNIIEIEEFIDIALKEKYKVISINKISWEIIKKEFNSKLKEYIYVPEDFDLKKMKKKKDKGTLNKYFESIIEYE